MELRNNDIRQVFDRMVSAGSAKNQIAPTALMPDVLIFMGDLNYRVSGYTKSIV